MAAEEREGAGHAASPTRPPMGTVRRPAKVCSPPDVARQNTPGKEKKRSGWNLINTLLSPGRVHTPKAGSSRVSGRPLRSAPRAFIYSLDSHAPVSTRHSNGTKHASFCAMFAPTLPANAPSCYGECLSKRRQHCLLTEDSTNYAGTHRENGGWRAEHALSAECGRKAPHAHRTEGALYERFPENRMKYNKNSPHGSRRRMQCS